MHEKLFKPAKRFKVRPSALLEAMHEKLFKPTTHFSPAADDAENLLMMFAFLIGSPRFAARRKQIEDLLGEARAALPAIDEQLKIASLVHRLEMAHATGILSALPATPLISALDQASFERPRLARWFDRLAFIAADCRCDDCRTKGFEFYHRRAEEIRRNSARRSHMAHCN